MTTHKQGSKETSINQRQKKMKVKLIELYQDKFARIIQQLKQWQEHKSKLGLKEKPRMTLE